jgi:hypothetical protein
MSTWYDTQAYGNHIYNGIDAIQDNWADAGNPLNPPVGAGWWITLALTASPLGAGSWLGYEAVNATIDAQLTNMKDQTMAGLIRTTAAGLVAAGYNDPLALVTQGLLSGQYYNSSDYVFTLWIMGSLVLETVRETLEAYGRDPAGYLFELMEAGQPPAEPATDFLKRAVKEFNHDEDDLIKLPFVAYGRDIPSVLGPADGEVSVLPLGIVDRFTGFPLGGETIYIYGYLDLDVSDDGILTIEVEYQDDQIDPKDDLRWLAYGFDVDGEDELEDYEVEFFGDDTVWKDGDTQFWVYGAVEQIPGYEVTIILGASAFAIMGLIYVVMKKRKM